MALAATMVAQTPTKASASRNPVSTQRDPRIVAAMNAVKAAELKRIDIKLVSFGTRLTLTSSMPAAGGRGIAAAREWITSEFLRYSKECGGCLEVKTHAFTEGPVDRIPKPTEIVNVYAVLRGSDPESAKRVLVIGGHYDSRAGEILDTESDAPGANDDGSGTAVTLEAARVLSKYKFPATIVFVAFASEEQGLNGSRHFAKMAKAEGWDVEAVLSNDMVGGDKSAGQNAKVVRVFSEGLPIATPEEWKRIRTMGAESDSESRQLARYISDIGAQYWPTRDFQPMLVFRQDRFLRGGDHTAFNEQGFAAVRLTDFRENYNHQHQTPRTENGIEYGDLPKFVDFEYMAKVARLNVATLAALASAPAPPAQVRILTKSLENDTTLTWQPSPGGAAKYEVLWRATTAPTWESMKAVGEQTEATLPQSKDNMIFAVRSVDGKGHRSLAVLPIPER
jgi:hypothetical protein